MKLFINLPERFMLNKGQIVRAYCRLDNLQFQLHLRTCMIANFVIFKKIDSAFKSFVDCGYITMNTSKVTDNLHTLLGHLKRETKGNTRNDLVAYCIFL